MSASQPGAPEARRKAREVGLARLASIRRVFFGGGLLSVALLATSITATTFAQAGAQTAQAEATQVQRPLSEDPLIDQNLVASLPTATPVSAPVPAACPTAAARAALSEDSDQQMAAIGPAMRPLVSQFNAIWPTAGEITTYFGEVGRLSPRGHSGLDIAAPEGTPIVAADDGEVLKAYWNEDGYGGLVIVGHPSGYETWYGHLDRLDVHKGERVKRGQEIGLMGSTGFSTGSHLHFEVRQDGQVCDPLIFLKKAKLKSVGSE
jgi:murein DD-endopeptidase MepM/ murein hydrolase activator NlpD